MLYLEAPGAQAFGPHELLQAHKIPLTFHVEVTILHKAPRESRQKVQSATALIVPRV